MTSPLPSASSPSPAGVVCELSRRELRMLHGFLDHRPSLSLQYPPLIGLSSWLETLREGELDDMVSFTLSLRQWETLRHAAIVWKEDPGAGLWLEAGELVRKLDNIELSVRVAEAVTQQY